MSIATSRLPQSVRRHIRTEKARIRRTVSDKTEAERQVTELMERLRAGRVSPRRTLHAQ